MLRLAFLGFASLPASEDSWYRLGILYFLNQASEVLVSIYAWPRMLFFDTAR